MKGARSTVARGGRGDYRFQTMASSDKGHVTKLIAQNKKARFEYDISDTWEAGLMLTGSEVKSMRAGHASLDGAFCKPVGEGLWLIGMHVSEYQAASYNGHVPKRDRKLLLHKHELEKLTTKNVERGFTIVPLRLYWRGAHVKVEIGLGRGKRQHDKRDAIADREAKRDIDRAMKAHR